MVDGQDVVVVDAPSDDVSMVMMPATVAQGAIEAVQLLLENGTWTDDYPFLPDNDAVLRFVVLRTFADSEVDPKFAIENTEKYIDYILHGAPKPAAEPVSPMKRRPLKAV